MPNWVENHLKYNGDESEIAEMLEKVKMNGMTQGTIDFEKIAPTPTESDLETWKHEVNGTNNMLKRGVSAEREWTIANWGTKWNACGYDEGTDYSDNDMIWFQTAWDAPVPVIQKLSEMYPNIEFTLQYADEDLGSNCGEIVFKNGEKTREYTPNNRKEALEFAAEVWGDDLTDYGYHINALGTGYVNTEANEYELIDILDKTCLYADERLTLGDIPQGLSLYHIRCSDDDERFATIEKSVTVNHGGSIIVDEPFDLGEKGYIEFTDETYPNFLNQTLTINDYVNDNYNTEMNDSDESEGFDICQ